MMMNKKISLLLFLPFFFFLSVSFAVEDFQLLPRPLPDEYYPPEPFPYPEPEPDPDPSTRVSYSLGSAGTGRFGTKSSRFVTRKNLSKIVRIRLASTSNKNDIRRVIATYADQSQRELFQLEGLLNQGEKREVLLDGRPIVSIDIAAAVPYFWKKAGRFKVDVISLGQKQTK